MCIKRVRRYPGKIRQINPKCLKLKGIFGGVRYLALSTTIIGLTYDLGVKIQGLDLASQIQGVVAKAVDMGRAIVVEMGITMDNLLLSCVISKLYKV
jgi:uncharacterized protein YebE (UPF0316 family)